MINDEDGWTFWLVLAWVVMAAISSAFIITLIWGIVELVSWVVTK